MQKSDSAPPVAVASGRPQRVCICLLLVAAGIALYWRVAGYDFISIDDHIYFAQNKHVLAGLTWRNLGWAFQTTQDASWYPLSWLSFMLDATLFGSGPAGPHLVNVVLHVANGILLFLLVDRLTGSLWRSAFVAALFVLHPLHVESVAWVSERKDVLSTLFGFLTLLAYARFAATATINSRLAARAYLGALLLYALSLLSKPMLVTLPFVMLLLDYWPLKRNAECGMQNAESRITHHASRITFHVSRLIHPLLRLFLEKVPFLLLATMASIVTVIVHKQVGTIASLGSVSMLARVENAFVAYGFYLRQTFWPTDLAMPYLHPGHWPLGPVLLGVALVAGFSATALWLRPRRPYLFVGWFWFLGTLVPVIGLLQWGSQSMADRFMYVPSVGLFIALAWGLGQMLERCRLPRAVVGLATALVLVALALRSRDQLSYWHDTEALFLHTIKVTTGNYVAYDCVGSALVRKGKCDDALPFLSESVRLQPRYPEGQYDLGTALMNKGRLEEATRHLAAAVRNKPGFADAHINLGKALLQQDKLDQALVHLREAVRLTPDDPEAHYNLGTVLLMQAKPDEAIACFSQALRLKPDYSEAHSNLGIALMREGKLGEGAAHLSAALRLNPANPDAHDNLGLALLELKQPREAADQFAEALRIKPDLPGAHYHLALALVQQNKTKEALPHAQKARDLALAAGQSALAAKAEDLLKQQH
jgi:tetratricopeptide (TPR) repeat protein